MFGHNQNRIDAIYKKLTPGEYIKYQKELHKKIGSPIPGETQRDFYRFLLLVQPHQVSTLMPSLFLMSSVLTNLSQSCQIYLNYEIQEPLYLNNVQFYFFSLVKLNILLR